MGRAKCNSTYLGSSTYNTLGTEEKGLVEPNHSE